MFFKNCCIGATAYSIGFALAHEDTLIIESSENVFSDYVNCIRISEVGTPTTEIGRDFFEFLQSKKYLKDNGYLDTPAFAPGGADYVFSKKLNVLLGTKYLYSDETGVTVYSNSGIRKIECENIIFSEQNGDKKELNCIVYSNKERTLKKFPGKIFKAFGENEFVASLSFNGAVTVNEARIEFEKIWKELFPKNKALLGYFADDFLYPQKYSDLLKEFEAGVTYDLP